MRYLQIDGETLDRAFKAMNVAEKTTATVARGSVGGQSIVIIAFESEGAQPVSEWIRATLRARKIPVQEAGPADGLTFELAGGGITRLHLSDRLQRTAEPNTPQQPPSVQVAPQVTLTPPPPDVVTSEQHSDAIIAASNDTRMIPTDDESKEAFIERARAAHPDFDFEVWKSAHFEELKKEFPNKKIWSEM